MVLYAEANQKTANPEMKQYIADSPRTEWFTENLHRSQLSYEKQGNYTKKQSMVHHSL